MHLSHEIQITSSPHQLIGNKLGDVCDGDMFREHPIFHQNPQAIQIVAYYDEMETANALGPKASKNNKLGVHALYNTNHIMYATDSIYDITFRCTIQYDSKLGALHEIEA